MIHPSLTNLIVVDKRRISVVWALNGRHARLGARQRGALRTVATSSALQQALNGAQASQQEISTRVAASVTGQRPPNVFPDIGRAPMVANAQSAARSLFAALNQRDVSAVLSLLADDVTYENLGSSTVLRGRAAVGRFYLEALAALPEDAVFVLEGPGGPSTDPWVDDAGAASGPVLQAGVAWRVELNGQAVPLSRGVGMYWADPRTGRLSHILDNPEHNVKQPAPSLTSASWASPLLRGLGPLVMPAAMSVGSFLTNMGPGGGIGGGGGGEATASGRAPTSKGGGGGGGGGGGLAGSVMSTLSSMMPFQSQSPAAAANRSGKETGSGGGSGGGIVPGGGRGPVYRDHTQANGAGGRAVAVAAAAASAAAAAVGGGGGGGAGLSAFAPKSQLGAGSSWPMRSNDVPASSGAVGGASAVTAAPARSTGATAGARPTTHSIPLTTTAAAASVATTTGLSNGGGGVRDAVTAAPSSAAAPAAPAASVAAAAPTATVATATVSGREGGVALSSTGEPIRMRPLSEPAPLTGASVSVASSLASLHDDDDDDSSALAATATASASAAAGADNDASSPPPPSGSATPGSLSTNGPHKVSRTLAGSTSSSSGGGRGGGSSGGGGSVAFGSMDSGSGTDTDTGDGGGPAPLPFPPSTSLAASLTGLWEKDLAASQVEAYESMLDVLELGGLQKVTARLIDGLDVRQDEQRFEISFVTVVPFFRVTEKSRFDGCTSMMRRDLRSGRQTAAATHTPGGVTVDMGWEAPLAGSLQEQYVISEDGEQMAVTSTIRIGARAAVATQVYRRSSRNKNELLASKRSSYGSMEDVLKSQAKTYGKMKN